MVDIKTIAVHGVGMVGGATARWLKENKQAKEVIEYDPPKGLSPDISEAELHILCVPTPYLKDGKGFDLSYVESACEVIVEARGDKPTVILIKSTVLPGSTNALAEKYPELIFLFNPEFLTELTADQDMKFPDRQLIGYADDRGYRVAGQVMLLLPLAPYEKIMTATEAELVKYFGNTWFSTKVIFANMMYDICQALDLEYDNVKEAASYDKRIGRTHLEVMHKGYRGYGGICLPKDTRALIQLCDRLEVDAGLLKEAERMNAILTGGDDHVDNSRR
jgi:UDPglucose 6-dehydrogenase